MELDQKAGARFQRIRRRLGLSRDGVRVLLRRDSEVGQKVILRYERGYTIPREVLLIFEMVLESDEAARIAGLDKLRREYPHENEKSAPA